VALLKAVEARNAVSIDSVLKRLQDLRGGTASPAAFAAPPAPQRAQSAAPAERRAPARPEPEQHSQKAEPVAVAETAPAMAIAPAASSDLETLWARLVEAAGRASPFVRSYLLEAHPVSFAKNIFTIGFAPEFEEHIGLVDNARNHTLLQTKMGELGHHNAQFKFIKAEPPANRAPAVIETPAPPVAVPQPKASVPPPSKPAPASSAQAAAKEKPASVPFNKDDFKNDPLIQKALEVFKGQIVEVRA